VPGKRKGQTEEKESIRKGGPTPVFLSGARREKEGKKKKDNEKERGKGGG